MEFLKTVFHFIITFLHTFDILILVSLYLYFSIKEIGGLKRIIVQFSKRIDLQNHLIQILMSGSCDGFSPLHRLMFYKTIEKNGELTKEEICKLSEEFNLKNTTIMIQQLEKAHKKLEEEGDHEKAEEVKQKIKAIKDIGTLIQLIDLDSSDEFKRKIIQEVQNIIQKINYD